MDETLQEVEEIWLTEVIINNPLISKSVPPRSTFTSRYLTRVFIASPSSSVPSHMLLTPSLSHTLRPSLSTSFPLVLFHFSPTSHPPGATSGGMFLNQLPSINQCTCQALFLRTHARFLPSLSSQYDIFLFYFLYCKAV